jgi:chemotaxis protein MotA
VNKSTLGGIGLSVSGIVVGLFLDGGRVGQLIQPTAALIVFGGTLGAVMLQFPFSVMRQALAQLKPVFLGGKDPAPQLIEDLMHYAVRARRNGLMSLDSELEAMRDPFLRKAMTLAVDGTRSVELRQRMEFEMDSEADKEDLIPQVYEAAGGFAPTIGILGAVIGLIQVMQRLQNIEEVGKGIAVAFVATIYGVGSANLFFLPCAGRIKILMRRKQVLRELVLDGVVSIVEKLNPRLFESKFAAYQNGPAAAARVAKLVAK